MSIAEIFQQTDEPAALDTGELASELIDLNTRLASMEARWLSLLAEFDRREGWREDGQLSCVDWLTFRCGLNRVTAREKLRVAHELERRPAVQAAFSAGQLSYTKVRAITRIAGADDETDQFLLKAAEKGTAADLERVAGHYEQLEEQNRPVDEYLRRWDRATVR